MAAVVTLQAERGDSVVQLLGELRWADSVGAPMQDQGWRADLFQPPSRVLALRGGALAFESEHGLTRFGAGRKVWEIANRTLRVRVEDVLQTLPEVAVDVIQSAEAANLTGVRHDRASATASSHVLPASWQARTLSANASRPARYDILDSPLDGAFNIVAGAAARLFGVPMATVSIVDTDGSGSRPVMDSRPDVGLPAWSNATTGPPEERDDGGHRIDDQMPRVEVLDHDVRRRTHDDGSNAEGNHARAHPAAVQPRFDLLRHG